MIPEFDAHGNLPPGIYWPTWDAFTARFGTSSLRSDMLKGLRAMLAALRVAGCRTVYVDGSFVTSKSVPGDFDACYEVVGVDPGLLDPVLLNCTVPGRMAQKARYKGEVFPNVVMGDSTFTFLEFFQMDRDGNPKGIIAFDLRRLS